MCKNIVQENFSITDDIKKAVNDLYQTDMNTIRNLGDLAKKTT